VVAVVGTVDVMTLLADRDASPAPGPSPTTRRSTAERLARWSTRHRWTAMLLWLLLVAGAVVGGSAAGTRTLTDGEIGAGESGRADRRVEQAGFPADLTERVLVQAPRGQSLGRAETRAVVGELRRALVPLPAVASVGDVVRSEDGRSAVLPLSLDVDGLTGTAAEDLAAERVDTMLAATSAVAHRHRTITVAQVGGTSIDRAIGDVVDSDFQRAETLSLPVTLGILLLAFGALFAAGVPLLLALSAVGTSIGLAGLVSHLLPVSDTLNSVVLLIGMAVGVDYSLFYVRRTREERARGASRREAIDIAAATSGRAVVVSGLAVIVAMAGLLLSGNAVFSSMAVGTMVVVAVAVLGSLTVLPAVLSLLGDKVDRPRIPLVHRLRRQGPGRFWPLVMRGVLAKPVLSLVVAGTALAALAVPALGMRLGESGADSLPRSIPEVRTYDAMTAAFPQTGFVHTVVVWDEDGGRLDRSAVTSGLGALVRAAERSGQFADLRESHVAFAPDGATATVDLAMTGDFNGDRAEASLGLLRDDLVPALASDLPGTEVAVTGDAAGSRDFTASLQSHLPQVFAFVLLVTFLVLVLAFRSVVIAATAVALNLLSVGAAYGLLTLVFQHGLATGLLGVHESGFIVDWLPLFLFVILFGLSMDYHVFVVSRVREAHELGEPTRAAIARGVTSSAGVVTSAAAVMVGVFSIFATLSLLEFEQLGIGLAAAVLLDATIVRAVLLPSAMAVLGRRNWWLPGWLDRVLPAGH
jgi:putative drug exporter of the RND superfamily